MKKDAIIFYEIYKINIHIIHEVIPDCNLSIAYDFSHMFLQRKLLTTMQPTTHCIMMHYAAQYSFCNAGVLCMYLSTITPFLIIEN